MDVAENSPLIQRKLGNTCLRVIPSPGPGCPPLPPHSRDTNSAQCHRMWTPFISRVLIKVCMQFSSEGVQHYNMSALRVHGWAQWPRCTHGLHRTSACMCCAACPHARAVDVTVTYQTSKVRYLLLKCLKNPTRQGTFSSLPNTWQAASWNRTLPSPP